MVVDGEKGFLSNQETATNGCEEQHNRRWGLTKGRLYFRGSQTVVRAPLVVRESLLGGARH